MKKIGLSILSTISFTCVQATTLIIDNSSNGNIKIPFIQTINLDSYSNYLSSISFNSPNNINNFLTVSSGSTYSITDGNSMNYQFPFLNQAPFIGQVHQNSNFVSLPLPVTNDNLNPSQERYILSLFRFGMNDHFAYSFSTYNNVTYSYEENVLKTFSYPGGGSTFEVGYLRFFSYYTFMFI